MSPNYASSGAPFMGTDYFGNPLPQYFYSTAPPDLIPLCRGTVLRRDRIVEVNFGVHPMDGLYAFVNMGAPIRTALDADEAFDLAKHLGYTDAQIANFPKG